ncbi:MAG: biotin carboxylase N-terminal domain-containing protein [Bacteroidota bacterium]
MVSNLRSILISNRGEIARRIIRTARKMGIRTVAIYSEADREAPYVREADMALFVGASNPGDSYLNQDKLIDLCKIHQIDGIHPGYGFLSENAGFARKCQEAGITFIGPHPEAIEAMGSKSRAKALMRAHGVPVIPGFQGEDQSTENLKEQALKVGFPLLLKAAAGGGGKGMRIVESAEVLEREIEGAQREAQNAFGDQELIIEKYVASGRHIEFQIFGDKKGNVVHVFERECTIQRRYQKVIEESPSPVLDEELRQKMAEAAILAAKALNYDNAGTVEFIFDDNSRDFYFLEVNTRLQVEHPVTEAITGLDLVAWQIQVAEGQALPLAQEEIHHQGYAVECRLYAEDPQNNFLPATGKILHWETPNLDGLRIDTGIESQSEISIYYDPMIAKVIVWDQSRSGAHRKMHYTLQNLACLGLTTNQDFLIALFENQEFREGKYNTHFLKNKFDLSVLEEVRDAYPAAIAATLFDWQKRDRQRKMMRALPSGWRNSFYAPQEVKYSWGEDVISVKYRFEQGNSFSFFQGEKRHEVNLLETKENRIAIEVDGQRQSFFIAHSGDQVLLRNEHLGAFELKLQDRFPQKEVEKIKGGYEAPMPSQVIQILVEVGQQIKAGDSLLVLSSMKMENVIYAEEEGVVSEVFVEAGQNVDSGVLLVQINSEEAVTN